MRHIIYLCQFATFIQGRRKVSRVRRHGSARPKGPEFMARRAEAGVEFLGRGS